MNKEVSNKKPEKAIEDNVAQAPGLPLHPDLEDRNHENKTVHQKMKETLHLFYTTPIFKYQEYDFY